MKKGLVVLITMITTGLLSGCVSFDVIETYNIYPTYYDLETISTTLPQETTIPAHVEMTITYPSGVTKGTLMIYSMTYNPVFNLVNYTLYQTGIYTVKYETSKIIKYDYFFVGTIDQRLVFEPITFTVESSVVDIEVMNDGTMDGFLYLVLFNNDPVEIGSKMVYGKSYINDVFYVRNGFSYEYSRSVGSDNLVLLVNGDVYKNG